MKYDFLNELKARISEINKKIEMDSFLQKSVEVTDRTLFNIHKRSLPVNIDKVVMFNLEKEEAEKMLENRFKTKVIRQEDDDLKTVIYYDLVPAQASKVEKSIFYNPKGNVRDDN